MISRTNGLVFFTYINNKYSINHSSVGIAVLPVSENKTHDSFSDGGDSGSVVLTVDAWIIGILTSGDGPTDESIITYVAPYQWVE